MPPLDTLAARAVARASLLARAVHDSGPWMISWAGQSVPAERVLDEERAEVRFYARLAAADAGSGLATLSCAGTLLSCREVEVPVPGWFEVEWALELREPVAA